METKTTIFTLDDLIVEMEDHLTLSSFLNSVFEDNKELLKENYKYLHEVYFEKKVGLQDLLNNGLLKIDFDFAKSLNLKDSIGAYCFTSDELLGKELIEFLADNNIMFYVCLKTYHNPKYIDMVFKIGNEYDILDKINEL